MKRRGQAGWAWGLPLVGGIVLTGWALPAAPGPGLSLDWNWELPEFFPRPLVPEDNPMSEAGFELGRHLFHDTRLSLNETQSCASCHVQELAFSDGEARSAGSTGEIHPRNSMSLANIAYASTLTWANPNLTRLEDQALIPMFGEEPVELGMSGQEDLLLERLAASTVYPDLFRAAFPGEDDPITVWNVVRALGIFQRGLLSLDSPYDRYLAGDDDAVSPAVIRGENLFFSERLECFHCHGGPFFSGATTFEGRGFTEIEFFNTGLYNLDGKGAYPPENTGIFEFTGDPRDMGAFRAPTLRNIEVTAPYMHDGSIATLDEVLDHYAAGGRTIEEGPLRGEGHRSPLRSEFIVGFELTPEEREDLLAFLRSLTDSVFLSNPRFADPWDQRRER